MTAALEGNKSLHRWQIEKRRRAVILTDKATAVTNEMWWLGARPFKKCPVVLQGVSGKAIHISKHAGSTAKTAKELEIPIALKISVPIHSLLAHTEHDNTSNQAPISKLHGLGFKCQESPFFIHPDSGMSPKKLVSPMYILCVFAHMCVLRYLNPKLSLPRS